MSNLKFCINSYATFSYFFMLCNLNEDISIIFPIDFFLLKHNLIIFIHFIYMKYLIYYLVIINIITFIVWGIDKRKARHHKRRISEKTLLILSILWWRIGAIFAIDTFRHKTIKSRFVWKLYLIWIIWIIWLIIYSLLV